MKRFIQGEHRGQGTLLPESLDNYVSDTNPVRVVDVFVDELDLGKRSFEGQERPLAFVQTLPYALFKLPAFVQHALTSKQRLNTRSVTFEANPTHGSETGNEANRCADPPCTRGI